MYTLHVIPVLKDNYIWILEDPHQQVIIIDPAEASPVITYLKQHHLSPVGILLTHHHADHIGGVTELQKHYSDIAVYGPTEIKLPITYLTAGQSNVHIADFEFTVISVPGHTLGHVAYYCKPYLFCGDTLFSAGCGRIFEGTYEQMLNSLNKLKALPDDTLVCAAHEYTLSNLKFAHTMLPEDTTIKQYLDLISKKTVTLPSLLTKEKQINLFLKCSNLQMQNKFNFNNELELFSFFRSQKDIF